MAEAYTSSFKVLNSNYYLIKYKQPQKLIAICYNYAQYYLTRGGS